MLDHTKEHANCGRALLNKPVLDARDYKCQTDSPRIRSTRKKDTVRPRAQQREHLSISPSKHQARRYRRTALISSALTHDVTGRCHITGQADNRVGE
jgi:hypothetical protein